jgi:hypothetical protein
MLYTTLNNIRDKCPCESGWAKLLKHLGKTQADDEQLSFKTILKSNGLDDAIWFLRSVEGHDREIRLFALACARRVEHLDKTGQAKKTNDVSEQFINGFATNYALSNAWADAAFVATLYAARDTASSTSAAAASAVASDYSWVAAWDARSAERSATSAAARDAAWSAAASGSEWSAAARDAAMDAGRDDAMDAQKEDFIKMFCTEGINEQI